MSDAPPKTHKHLGARAIRSLLTQQGHPKHKHTAVLAEITGLSQPQANRKLSGASGWEIDELNSVCLAFGATLIDVLEPLLAGESLEALLACGERDLACDITLDQQLPRSPVGSTLVAARLNDVWRVGTAEQLSGHDLWSLRKAALRVNATHHKPRCAVLDSNEDVAVSIATALRSTGFAAEAFHSAASLAKELEQRVFDVFLIDWPIQAEDDTWLLNTVRQRCPAAVVALLASNRSSNEVVVAKLSAALRTYDAEYIAKPSPIGVIAAILSRNLARKRDATGASA
jgi:ActR/RegA family two-component response regulator